MDFESSVFNQKWNIKRNSKNTHIDKQKRNVCSYVK